MELSDIDRCQPIFVCQPARRYVNWHLATCDESIGDNLLDEVIPMNDIFRNIVYSVFEVEPVTVTIHIAVASFFEPDRVHVVPKRKVRLVGNGVKVVSAGLSISIRQYDSSFLTHSNHDAFGMVPMNVPPGRSHALTFSIIVRAFFSLSNA